MPAAAIEHFYFSCRLEKPYNGAIVSVRTRRGSQVVRQRSAKPLFTGSNPVRASKFLADRFFVRR